VCNALFDLRHFGNPLGSLGNWKSFLQRIDGVHEVIAARCHDPCENRISGVRLVGYAGTFLFGRNVAIEQLGVAMEFADHLPDQGRFALCSRMRIKMTLAFHRVLQNSPGSLRIAVRPGTLAGLRKKLARARHAGSTPAALRALKGEMLDELRSFFEELRYRFIWRPNPSLEGPFTDAEP
jgi:hypothetical protein